MPETKHTPGPWAVSQGTAITAPMGAPITPGHSLCVATTCAWDGEPQRQANARLIAAAPDLLAACQSAEETFRQYALIHRLKGIPGAEHKAIENERLADEMRTAIEKAVGA